MVRFKLVPYAVRIRRKMSEDYVVLDKIPMSGGFVDFFKIFTDFLRSYTKQSYILQKDRKTLYVEDLTIKDEMRIVHGIIKSGEYGYEADFYDVKAQRRIPGARKVEHSEELPFFFLFHSPLAKNRDRGFLILEKFKNFGVRSVFGRSLQNYMKVNIDENLIVEIHPIIGEDLMKKLESADRILELKLIKKKVPKDVADKVLIENYEDVYEERSFKIKRNKNIFFKKMESLIETLKNVTYPYYEVKGEKYDDIKIVIEEGKSQRTLSLGELKFRESMPLNEKTLKFERGFPTHDSLYREAVRYLNMILEAYGENLIDE